MRSNYIDGTWTASADPGGIDVVNPADQSVIDRVPAGHPSDVDDAVMAARAASGSWAATPAANAAKYTVGDPFAEGTRIGPLASATVRDRVIGYIEQGVAEGARIVTGGTEPIPGLEGGNYVRSTIFADVKPEMTIARDEIFGPVLAVLAYGTEDEAIVIANGTPYGLAGAVWSADQEHAVRVARQLRAGQIEINGGAFNVTAPFGGFGQSGHGRELGVHGLEEYLELIALLF